MRFASLPQEVVSRLNVLGLEQLVTFRFGVQIDGCPTSGFAGFQEVRNLGDSLDIREVVEGGHAGRHRFPRRSKVNELVLARGMSFSRDLFDWYREVLRWGDTQGNADYRRTLSIYMLDEIKVGPNLLPYEVWRWDVHGAWPSEWHGPKLDANASEFAIEAVTIQHEGITQAQGIFSGAAGTALSLLT